MIMTAEQGAGYFKGSRRRRVGLVGSIRFDSIGFGSILSVFRHDSIRFWLDSIGFGSILSVFVRTCAFNSINMLSTQSTSIRLWTLILLAMTVPIDLA